jgi:threonine/homoserine/homoserine lactone efflux protein
MSALVVSALAGVVLGLSLAAPPGPMNAIIAEESVVRGWLAGFRAGLGAMSADACFLLVALAGVATVLRDAPTLRTAMTGVGGVLMLYFALDAARSARESFGDGEVGPSRGSDGRSRSRWPTRTRSSGGSRSA